MKLQDSSLQVYEKTVSHILFPAFCLHFLRFITITSSKEALKVCEHNFFQRKVVLLVVICLFNHDSWRQIFSCCIWDLTFFWVQFLSNKLESFVSCNIKLLFCVLICTFLKNLIILHHGGVIFFSGICIKFTLQQ